MLLNSLRLKEQAWERPHKLRASSWVIAPCCEMLDNGTAHSCKCQAINAVFTARVMESSGSPLKQTRSLGTPAHLKTPSGTFIRAARCMRICRKAASVTCKQTLPFSEFFLVRFSTRCATGLRVLNGKSGSFPASTICWWPFLWCNKDLCERKWITVLLWHSAAGKSPIDERNSSAKGI